MGELNRVLGGGIVPGSATLIGGSPGIGKSTLLLQCAGRVAATDHSVLYVSAEESASQVKLRAERLEVNSNRLILLSETRLERIIRAAEEMKPSLLLIDSLQTVADSTLESTPGTVSQVRQVAGRLTALAKVQDSALFLVGHVTKEGAIAGPRVVEHLVDTVLYFEESTGNPYRLLRAVKNRFGSTNELGVFEMGEGGLKEVANPSELFLAERPVGSPGSVVAVAQEGTRPLLVEVQALVSDAGHGNPRRTALGVDPNRAALLIAILEKKAGTVLADQDVYVNIAGGVRLREPAADLPVAMAIASSVRDRPVDAQTAFFGELGLAGEVRAVTQAQARIREAAKLGFKRIILPQACLKGARPDADIECVGIRSIEQAMDATL
jgi:DNA repair protein RadA/Sms